MADTLTETVYIRVTPEMKAELEELSQSMKAANLSDFLRMLLEQMLTVLRLNQALP